MKMGKKVKEYKAGDFIFAKVKGYPAWPARVQRLNGKKYFVYFYGTGEIANLPPNMIFDYAENKDKFLTKTVKRRDFNDGVKQIEHDFANNVPLEEVVGTVAEAPADASANDTLNDSANDTMNDSAIGDTSADETLNDTAPATEAPVDDSDDTNSLVIDEGKKGKKPLPKTPAKETPKGKELKTPRGRAKKDDAKDDKEDEKKEAEIISRSGRKIRPKRYIDEQTEDNATLPSPAAKKRRGQTPEKEKEKETTAEEKKKEKADKNIKLYNTVPQSDLEDLKEPVIAAAGSEKENILITYLPTGTYVGIKLFQNAPASFKTEKAKQQWYKMHAANALTLKMQLERGQVTPKSLAAQLVTDLNLTDEEKATLDKERETEEKKSRVQFLKTEMKLIELDAKIKTCLCLEKADTESCLKLLDELMELNLKPLMLLKHPTCVETVKRMRAYVGNTPCWGLSEAEVLQFSKHAQCIRKQADTLYNNMKSLFYVTDGLSFWEYFSERVLQFKKVTAKLDADVLLEMVHEPIEMSVPTSHTMKAAIESANNDDDKLLEEAPAKKKTTPAKKKKDAAPTNSTPSKSLKRQSSRNKQAEKEPEPAKEAESQNGDETAESPNKETEAAKEKQTDKPVETTTEETELAAKDKEEAEANTNKDNAEENEKATENDDATEQNDQNVTETDKNQDETEQMEVDTEKDKEKDIPEKETEGKDKEETEKNSESEKKSDKDAEKQNKVADKQKKEAEKTNKDKEKEKEDVEHDGEKKESDKNDKGNEKSNDKDKNDDEPRAKRSRETKKTEAPPSRSPAKRKSKV